MNPKATRKQAGAIVSTLAMLAAAPAALAGGWIAYSNLAVNHALPLPKALDAEREVMTSPQSGLLSYYAAREVEGRPLVLLHAINAAGSAYEVRPLFQHYRARRPVYALDWPGFGLSERTDRIYTPQLYADALIALLAKIGEPADVVALSLASEFAAFAARTRPDLVRSLALISPSGFTARGEGRASYKAAQEDTSGRVYDALSYPLWGRAFYDLLGTRPSIQYFLKQSFEGPVDRGLAEYDYATSHQPGAHYAPLYFVSGTLFTRDAAETLYAQYTQPGLVLYDQDAFVRFDLLPAFLQAHPNWRAERIAPTRGLPQFERLVETVHALDTFWQD